MIYTFLCGRYVTRILSPSSLSAGSPPNNEGAAGAGSVLVFLAQIDIDL